MVWKYEVILVSMIFIRPDPAFLTWSRDLQKQNRYIDQYDGPSSLISQSPWAKAQGESINLYENERKTFYRSFANKKLMDLPAKYLHSNRNIDNSLSSSTNQVKTPKQQYFEFKYGWVINYSL